MLKAPFFIALMLAATPAASEAPGSQTVLGERIQADVRVATARYDDLDLTSETGRRTLQLRIGDAIREVCPRDADRQFGAPLIHMQCKFSANAAARAQMDLAVASAMNGPQLASAGAISISSR